MHLERFYSLWGCKESDMTGWLNNNNKTSRIWKSFLRNGIQQEVMWWIGMDILGRETWFKVTKASSLNFRYWITLSEAASLKVFKVKQSRMLWGPLGYKSFLGLFLVLGNRLHLASLTSPEFQGRGYSWRNIYITIPLSSSSGTEAPTQVEDGKLKWELKIPRILPCYFTTNQSEETHTSYSPHPKFCL